MTDGVQNEASTTEPKEVVSLSDERIDELKAFNKNALKKAENESAFIILEMNRETGQQTLVAIPNYHCPKFGPPIVKCIRVGFGDSMKDFQTVAEAADYAESCGAKVFTYGGPPHDASMVHVVVRRLMDDDDPYDEINGSFDNMVPWENLTESQKEYGVPDEQFIFVQEYVPGTTAPLFWQMRDDDDNRLYHSQATMFATEEFAESYVKERGIEDHAYAILEMKRTVIGEIPIATIIGMDQEEHEIRVAHFEELRKSGAIVDAEEEPEEPDFLELACPECHEKTLLTGEALVSFNKKRAETISCQSCRAVIKVAKEMSESKKRRFSDIKIDHEE